MKFDFPHTLDSTDALDRLHRLGQYLHRRHGIAVSWSAARGSFRGRYLVVAIEGELDVAEGVVRVSGKDPGFLWRKKAVEYLRRKLAMYLDPTTPPAELPV